MILNAYGSVAVREKEHRRGGRKGCPEQSAWSDGEKTIGMNLGHDGYRIEAARSWSVLGNGHVSVYRE